MGHTGRAMAFAYDPGQAYLYVESASGTQDFYIDDFKLADLPPIVIPRDIPSIYQTLAQYFPGGSGDRSDRPLRVPMSGRAHPSLQCTPLLRRS